MNYRDFLQKIIYQCINPLIKGMIKIGVTPNIITFMGFVGNIIAAAFFVLAAMKLSSDFQTGIILFAGLFDMIDGRLARLGNMSSVFGALWDSTLDRYSELVSLFGIVLIFIENDQFVMGIVTFAAMIGSVMVSYVRARAEGINLECKVGFMQRPERVVVTAVTALISGFMQSMTPLAIGMMIIAIFANMTAFWRIGYCYKQLNKNGKNN